VDGVFNCLPCCDSYAVTAAAAARLVAALVPQRFATNVNLSWCLRSLELRAQLVAPNLFADGSKVGVYLSSIDVNNRLVWNPQFCRVEQLVNAVRTEKRALTPAERAELLELEASMRFKEHPDVAHLFAVFAASERRYAHAEAHFKHAMDLYDREMSLMGPKCQFLRDYMALYRHVQGGPAEQAGATAVASAVTAV
jgi:hypothetical protein